jgi:TRAP-type C4-dicarboxylate transport system substrate-binding protein
VQNGVADMSYFGPGIPGNPIVLGKIISLPFMGINSNEMTTAVYGRLLKESPELIKEYKGVKVLGPFGIPMDNLHLSKKAVHVPEDIKGMKILTLGSRVNFLKDIGATPVTIGVGEWYTSLERGLAEGLYFLFPVLPIFKLENQFQHHTVINGSATINMFIFNQRKWDSIPPDLQEVITEGTKWRVMRAHEHDRAEQQRVLADLKKRGHTIYTPTPEEMKLWEESAKGIHEKWIKDVEAKGLPARKIYDRFKTFIAEYRK